MGEPDPEMVSEQPRGHLEQIGDRLLRTVTDEDRAAGVKVIVLVRDAEGGAACATGYDEGAEELPAILTDLLGAAGMLSEAMGAKMHVFPMGGGGPPQG